MSTRFKIIDIGHKGFSLDRAITELEIKVSECIHKGDVRVVKIIHGHGTGALRNSGKDVLVVDVAPFESWIVISKVTSPDSRDSIGGLSLTAISEPPTWPSIGRVMLP